MADGSGDLDLRKQAENRLMAAFVECLGADGVIVIYTFDKGKETKGRLASWGNAFTTKGLLEWAYEEVFGEVPDEEEEDDNLLG
tara:strand:- start:164 stop:415 length:252 start_codon:yes stop_codon:yes gene_type:complete